MHQRAQKRVRLVAGAMALGLGLSAGCADDSDDDPATTTAAPLTATSADPGSTSTSTTIPTGPQLDGLALALTPVGELPGPIDITYVPGDDDLWVASKNGLVTRIAVETGPDGEPSFQVEDQPIADLTERVFDEGTEQGLLGIAIAPDGRHFYASYTNNDGDGVLERFDVTGGSDPVDESAGEQILLVEDPFPNHNGGAIRFGPDGFLYVAFGDGGAGGDPLGSGQDTNVLLGKILRIDVDTDQGYEIPADNPFAADDAARPEIWLYGVRNPWRFSFDRGTDDLWIGDVGQNAFEEIDLLPAADGAGSGANLGWNLREGDQPFNGGEAPDGAIEPIHTYGRDLGCSVTGGYMYRGEAIPELRGTYVYGDYCTAVVRGLVVEDGEVTDERSLEISVPETNLGSFGEGPDGELYVLSLIEGVVYRIEGA